MERDEIQKEGREVLRRKFLDFDMECVDVLIGKQHSNLYGTHSWYGDTIGFWNGMQLVMSTKYLYPADFTRWLSRRRHCLRLRY